MYKLHNNPILYPYQVQLLSLFSTSPFGKPFFLTGGVDKFETLPKMKIPFDKDVFIQFYKDLSQKLLLKIKPKK